MAIEYIGDVVEMGDTDTGRGIIIDVRPNVELKIIGFARHDMMLMPNLIYKKVRISIDVIDDA